MKQARLAVVYFAFTTPVMLHEREVIRRTTPVVWEWGGFFLPVVWVFAQTEYIAGQGGKCTVFFKVPAIRIDLSPKPLWSPAEFSLSGSFENIVTSLYGCAATGDGLPYSTIRARTLTPVSGVW
jgi:hypothetical protein